MPHEMSDICQHVPMHLLCVRMDVWGLARLHAVCVCTHREAGKYLAEVQQEGRYPTHTGAADTALQSVSRLTAQLQVRTETCHCTQPNLGPPA